METIVPADRRRHHPAAGAEAAWQESCYLGWADLARGVAGAHHISLAPAGSSHVWSWLLLDGRVVRRAQAHDLPLPEGDLDDLRVGSLHVRTPDGLRGLALRAAFEGAEADLTFAAHADPVVVDFNQEDTILADRHYEMAGAVGGLVRVDGREVRVDGAGWHDHSWGRRVFKTNPSHRWLFAVFGEDFAISAFSFVTGPRRASFGWVLDAGALHPVEDARFHAVVNDDGLSPEGCDAEILAAGGRGYRVRGRCVAHALMGGKGWFGMDGITRFECGGRIGQGFLEIAELKVMTPAMAAELQA